MSEDADRRRQPASVVREVLAQRQVHPGRHAGQHAETVGLLKGQVSQDLHGPQERKVLHLRQLLRHRRQGDPRSFFFTGPTHQLIFVYRNLIHSNREAFWRSLWIVNFSFFNHIDWLLS